MTKDEYKNIAVGLASAQLIYLYRITVASGLICEPERAFEHWVSMCSFHMDEEFKDDVWRIFIRDIVNVRNRN
jgi:hypothetical protein